MYQYKGLDDTIVAISTAMGQGGIGIIRLSGQEAVGIVEKMFVAANKEMLSAAPSHTVHYGWIFSEGNQEDSIDEVLVTVMRAPRSYTTEDVVEINCHGGVAALRAILFLACDLGARLAEPGEFTKRAFLKGRIDLTQAEAVLDIIQSKTEAFLQVSAHQLKGELSSELEHIREQLMEVYVEIEAIVNFPEDDTEVDKEARNFPLLEKAKKDVEQLLASSEHGKILKDGIKIVICGKPNVGKSSLLNILLKTPRAIVSDIAGTTRDTIEETAQIKGIPFQLIDTAGILEPRDILEEEAIKRSHRSMQSAELVLLVLDVSEPLTSEDEALIDKVKGRNVLVVLNKCDLSERIDARSVAAILGHQKIVKVSALNRIGMEGLEAAIVENVWHGKTVDTHGVLVSNLRHINALKSCQEGLVKAKNILREGLSLEFISEEIKMAVNDLDSITGRNVDRDLLDNIFTQFCIGK